MLKYLVVTILFSGLLFATPYWYDSQIYKSNGTSYFGYGEGSTKNEARQNAYEEIAQQLNVCISSIVNIRSTDDKSTAFHDVTVSSDVILKESKIHMSTFEDGKYYIVVKYTYSTPLWFETRRVDAPLFSKLGFGSGNSQLSAINSAKKDLLAQNYNPDHLKVLPLKSEKLGKNYFIAISMIDMPNLICSEPQNKLISYSRLIKEANKLTSCDYPYQLSHINNRWNLQYANSYFVLNKNDFDSFFNTIDNPTITLTSKQSEYQEGEGFHLDFNIQKSGHLTLFNIYEDGRVGLIIENRVVQKRDDFSFPSLESKQEFYAVLNTKGKDAKDMYIAILSDAKLNLSSYKAQDIKLVDVNEYRFQEVIDLVQEQMFSTLVLRTIAK